MAFETALGLESASAISTSAMIFRYRVLMVHRRCRAWNVGVASEEMIEVVKKK